MKKPKNSIRFKATENSLEHFKFNLRDFSVTGNRSNKRNITSTFIPEYITQVKTCHCCYKGLNTICQMFKTNTLCISFLHKVAKKTFTFKKQGPYNIMTQMQKLKCLFPDISMIHYRVLRFTILKSFLFFQ